MKKFKLIIMAMIGIGISHVMPVYALEEYEFVTKWGSYGSGNGQFKYPYGVAVDGSGNVYVADTSSFRIQKFNSNGEFITKWGSYGSGDGQFKYPYGVAVDGSGNVYVADTQNYRIQKFTSSGEFITKWGSYGVGDGQFQTPSGVAVDSSGNVYVADNGLPRIQKFNSNGGFITKWGSQYPYGVAVDGSGNVYVTDWGNNRIQKFNSNGGFITKWGSYGSGDGQFSSPYGVAVDGSGNVYIADRFNHRIQKFTSSGGFITKWGSYGSGDGQFAYPRGIAVDGSGHVYVADTSNSRIQKFRIKSQDTTPPAAVTDLAVSSATVSSLTLTWKAPGDDGYEGTATSYDVRYRTDHVILSGTDFDTAIQVIGEPPPQIAGSRETFTVNNLEAGTNYYFALRTADDASPPNVSALSNSPFGKTLCPKLGGVPDDKQTNYAIPETHKYDNLLATNTIKDWGCALTSVVNLINFNRPNTTTPPVFDDLLAQTSGYEGVSINWTVAGRLSQGAIRFKFDASRDVIGTDGSRFGQETEGELKTKITERIKIGQFVIVKVRNFPKGHWVLAISSECAGTWQINDPGSNKTKLSEYDNRVFAVRIYEPGPQSRVMSYAARSPIEMKLTDPQGNIRGGIESGDTPTIPNSSYFVDDVGNDTTGEPDPEPVKRLFVGDPSTGTYKLEIIGTGLGSYSISIKDIPENLSENITSGEIKGVVLSGQTQVVQLNYTGQAGQPFEAKKEVTIALLKEEVSNARQTGMIDEPGISNSLTKKLEAAQASLDCGQTKTAKNQLNAFINEVEAQSGKHITKETADILISDANTLIASLINSSAIQPAPAPQLLPEEEGKKKNQFQAPSADPTFKLGEVYAFPNPAKKWNPILHIESGIAERVDIRIYDISGKMVHETSITEQPKVIDDGQGPQYAYEYEWNTSGIASGTYIYVIEAHKGDQTLKKKSKVVVIK